MKKTKAPTTVESISSALILKTPSAIDAALKPPAQRKEMIEALALRLIDRTRKLRDTLRVEIDLRKREFHTRIREDAIAAFKSVKDSELNALETDEDSRRRNATARVIVDEGAGRWYFNRRDSYSTNVCVGVTFSAATKKAKDALTDVTQRFHETNWVHNNALSRTDSPLAVAKRLVTQKMEAASTNERVHQLVEKPEVAKALDAFLDKIETVATVTADAPKDDAVEV